MFETFQMPIAVSGGAIAKGVAATLGGLMFWAGVGGAAADEDETGVAAFSFILALITIFQGIIWFAKGHYSIHWVLAPHMACALLVMIAGFAEDEMESVGMVCGGMALALGAIVYLIGYFVALDPACGAVGLALLGICLGSVLIGGAAAEYEGIGIVFGCFLIGATVLLTGLWLIKGPFAVHYILIPLIVLGFFGLIAGGAGESGITAAFGLFVLIICAASYGVRASVWKRVDKWMAQRRAKTTTQTADARSRPQPGRNSGPPGPSPKPQPPKPTPPPKPAKPTIKPYWPSTVRPSGTAGLSSMGIPIRVVARKPATSLYRSSKTVYPQEVVGTMQPWAAYGVLEENNGALRVATGETAGSWAKKSECLCWSTRLCINIEKTTPIYGSSEDAAARRDPVEKGFAYRYEDHGADLDRRRPFRVPALPLLARDKQVYCFAVPAESGYEARWLRWDGKADAVTFRVRTTRAECEAYLQRLLATAAGGSTAGSPGTESRKQEIYRHGIAFLTHSTLEGESALNADVERLRVALPAQPGFLSRSLTQPLELRKLRGRALRLEQYLGTLDWEKSNVAYLETFMMP